MKESTFTQKCNISLNGILAVLRYDKSFFSFAISDTKKEETTFYRFYGTSSFVLYLQSHVFLHFAEANDFVLAKYEFHL